MLNGTLILCIGNLLDWETSLFMTGGLIRGIVSRKEKSFNGDASYYILMKDNESCTVRQERAFR